MVGQRAGPFLTAHGSEGSLARLWCGSAPAWGLGGPWGSTGGCSQQLSGMALGAAEPSPRAVRLFLGSRSRAGREGMSLDWRPAAFISEH